MDGAEHEIEPVPILLHPAAAFRGVLGIVIQLNPGADFEIGIGLAQSIDLIKIDAGVITVVICKGDVAQSNPACLISPGLEQFLRIRL